MNRRSIRAVILLSSVMPCMAGLTGNDVRRMIGQINAAVNENRAVNFPTNPVGQDTLANFNAAVANLRNADFMKVATNANDLLAQFKQAVHVDPIAVQGPIDWPGLYGAYTEVGNSLRAFQGPRPTLQIAVRLIDAAARFEDFGGILTPAELEDVGRAKAQAPDEARRLQNTV